MERRVNRIAVVLACFHGQMAVDFAHSLRDLSPPLKVGLAHLAIRIIGPLHSLNLEREKKKKRVHTKGGECLFLLLVSSTWCTST